MSSTEYVIRFGTREDCKDIAEIYAPYVNDTVISFEEHPPDEEEIWRRMRSAFELHSWLVCEYEGRVVGFAYGGPYRARKAYQWVAEVSIYVHPEQHKKGLATCLYQALHEILEQQGYVMTYAGMTLPNIPSQKFHESFGYKAFAVYENSGFKFGNWHSTGWWQRPLGELPTQPQAIRTIKQLDPNWVEKTFREASGPLNQIEGNSD